jgi:hypothetical protein
VVVALTDDDGIGQQVELVDQVERDVRTGIGEQSCAVKSGSYRALLQLSARRHE